MEFLNFWKLRILTLQKTKNQWLISRCRKSLKSKSVKWIISIFAAMWSPVVVERSPTGNLTNGRLITIICRGGFRVYFHICPAKLFVVIVSSEMIQVQWGYHHQVEFFDWFFATQFLRSGTSIKTILSLYIKTPPPFYFWICKKMRRKMTSQRGMHKCDKLMLINALHLSYKNILKEFCWQFFWHVSQLWICFIQFSKIRKKYI